MPVNSAAGAWRVAEQRRSSSAGVLRKKKNPRWYREGLGLPPNPHFLCISWISFSLYGQLAIFSTIFTGTQQISAFVVPETTLVREVRTVPHLDPLKLLQRGISKGWIVHDSSPMCLFLLSFLDTGCWVNGPSVVNAQSASLLPGPLTAPLEGGALLALGTLVAKLKDSVLHCLDPVVQLTLASIGHTANALYFCSPYQLWRNSSPGVYTLFISIPLKLNAFYTSPCVRHW